METGEVTCLSHTGSNCHSQKGGVVKLESQWSGSSSWFGGEGPMFGYVYTHEIHAGVAQVP